MATKKTKIEPVRGRPTLYKPEYCQSLIDFMAQGFSFKLFAGEIDVNEDTLFEWANRYPDFSDSKKKAFIKCQKFWEQKALDHLVNFSSKENGSESLNTALWIFNMKNRFKWTDRVDVTENLRTRTGLEEVSDEDLDAL